MRAGAMRWAVGIMFLGVFALYYGISESLPRGTGARTSADWDMVEGSSSDAAVDVERKTTEAIPGEDPSIAPVRGIVLAVNGNRLKVGPGADNGFEVGLGMKIFRGRVPASGEQWIGHAKVVSCTPDTAELEIQNGEAAVDDFVISEPLELPREVYVPKATQTSRPAPMPSLERGASVKLQALVENPGKELVSFGFPFSPGEIDTAEAISVWINDEEVPSAVKSLGPWRMDGQPQTPRSVLVQFELDFQGKSDQTAIIRWNRPRTQSRELVPIVKTLVLKTHVTRIHDRMTLVEYEEPRVLAMLPIRRLCDSWVAGPQIPAAEDVWLPKFEQNLEEAWHKPESGARGESNLSGDFAEQQLDRTVMLYRHYFRTGDPTAARDAYRHATFYRKQVVSPEESKRGRGAFKLKHTREEIETAWLDVKYAYAEGPATHYWLSGDERFVGTLEDLSVFWDSEFGTFIRNDYAARPRGWTERFSSFAWLNWLHAYQVTGNPHYLERAREQCNNVYRMQFQPPDGYKPDGSWRHSSEHHGEGGNLLGSSVWMSALMVDAIFQHWLLTGDERCPHMLVAYTEFAERYGVHWFSWADQTNDKTSDAPRWAQPWYYASATHGSMSDTGGESDHNVDVGYIFLMGYYFRQDPRYLFWGKELIQSPQARVHPRMLTWCYRASPQAAWFLREVEREKNAGSKSASR